MLTIQRQQFRALELSRLQRFEDRLAAHLKRFFPDQCRALGDTMLHDAVQYGGERARAHGFATERTICKYLNLMFTFGHDFDVDPELPWAAEILNSGSAPSKRMERLYKAALERESEGHGLVSSAQ